MPKPFSYAAHLRFTPPAGDVVDFNISALEHPTVIRIDPRPIFLQKETVNRGIRNVPIGWRISINFVIQVQYGSASETTLVNLAKRLLVLGEKMEVSLDGTLYREAHLLSWQRQTDEDKNVDAVYQLSVVLAELLTEGVVAPETLTSPPAIAGWA